ncbi:MAG: autotransporter domain-containing protein [Candidatus Paracaedibacteraceae bacterium]|nr:autotransporter domain-containing protein [Candidatus Paracaedibacteraceae bacterium]
MMQAAGGGGGNTTSIIGTLPCSLNGGNGGNGGPALGSLAHGGGGGGGGGDGAVITAQDITVEENITGGDGGSGGQSGSNTSSNGGAGGGGGAGILFLTTATLINNNTITGGAGAFIITAGNSGAGVVSPSFLTVINTGSITGGMTTSAGSAGAGIHLNGGSILNSGTITGGNSEYYSSGIITSTGTAGANGSGGASGWHPDTPYQATAGTGILASSGNTTITNKGAIKGGELNSDSPPYPPDAYANAITFSGSGNTLILEDGYSFTGNIAAGGSDTLVLTGPTNSSFDTTTLDVLYGGSASKYTDFSTFVKNDSSTWSWTGAYDTSANGITQTPIDQGTINAGNNPITFSAGHTLTYTLNGPADTAAKLTTTGLITLGGHLEINRATGKYVPGTSYTLLEGNINNGTEFDSVSVYPLSATERYTIDYTHNVRISFKLLPLAATLKAGNPGTMAQYLDNHGPTALVENLNTLNTPELTKALNDLSPADWLHRTNMTSKAEMAQMDSAFTWANMDRVMRGTEHAIASVITKLAAFKQSFNQLFASKLHHKTTAFALNRDTDPKHLPASARVALGKATFWIQGTAGHFSQDNIADPSGLSVQGLNGNTADTSIGWDYALTSNFKVGLTTGYGHSQYKMKANGDKGSTNSARIGFYGLWQPTTAWYVNGAAYYGHHHYKSDRIMTVLPAVAHQKHQGHQVSGLIEVGRDIILPNAITLTPYVSGGALYLQENGYTETGAGLQNLAIKRHHSTTAQGKAGAQLSKLWHWNETTQVYSFAKLGVTYRHALKKHQRISGSLVGQGGQFTVTRKNKARLLVNPSVGATAFLKKDVSATLAYEGEMGSTQRNHQAMIRVNWGF